MTHARRFATSPTKSPALTGGDDQHWSTRALCAQTDPETFFPDKGRVAIDTATAKRLCNGDPKRDIAPCPVKAQCLAEALKHDERYGVFGGLDADERRELDRERK